MKIKLATPQLIFTLVGLMFLQSTSAGLSLRLNNGESIKLYEKSYALLVGVGDYDEWPDLPGVESDMAEVSSILEEKHGFTVIIVKNPTRSEFDVAMRDFISKYGQEPDNRLLFYFAGHGHSLKSRYGGQLGYIIPSNASLPDEGIGKFKQKAISMLEMEIYAKQMESKHALFLFDSCFSGSLFALTRSIPPVISAKLALPVRQFITSGSADQKVPDESIFRAQFVEALKGDADVNNDGYITGTELALFLVNKVTNYSRSAQIPQYGKIRDPYLDKGDFIFFRSDFLKKKYAKKVEPKLEPEVVQVIKVDPLKLELAYWESIKTSDDVTLISSYIDKYPTGQFANLAKLKIKSVGHRNKSNDKEVERLKKEYDIQSQNMKALLLNQQKLTEASKRLSKEYASILKSGQGEGSKPLIFIGENNKIVIGAYSDMKIHWNNTLEQHSIKMRGTLKARLKKYVNHRTQFYDVVDFDLLEKIIYSQEHSDYKKLCSKHTADHVVIADYEDLQDYVAHWERSLTVSIFNCQTQEYAKTKFTPGYDDSDKYTGEKGLGRGFNKFVRNYLRGDVELTRN